MAIRKVRGIETNFTIIPNAAMDDNLSWAAKGLLSYLCTKPENWEVSVQQLCNHSKLSSKSTGRDGTYSILKELIDKGYVQKDQERQGGKFGNSSYIVSSTPFTDLPYTAAPLTANTPLISKVLKQVNTNTKEGIKDIALKETSAIDKYHQGFVIFYNAGLRKKDPKGCESKFKALAKKMQADPIELARLLEANIKPRLENGEFGFDRLHPTTYLNKERWNDELDSTDNGFSAKPGKQTITERILQASGYGTAEQRESGQSLGGNGGYIRGAVDERAPVNAIDHVDSQHEQTVGIYDQDGSDASS